MNFNPIQKSDLQEKYTAIPVVTVLRKATANSTGIMRLNEKAVELLGINDTNLNIEIAIGKSDDTDDLMVAIKATSAEKFEIINMESGLTNTVATVPVKKNKSETATTFTSTKMHGLICDHFQINPLKEADGEAQFYCELTSTENGWAVLNLKTEENA